MHYLRFVKQPRLTLQRGQPHVQLLFTIQTDLGDAFYPCDASVAITLRIASSGHGAPAKTSVLLSQCAQWQATDRQVSFACPVPGLKPSSTARLVVRLAPEPAHAATVKRARLPHGAHIALPPLVGCESLVCRENESPDGPLRVWRVLSNVVDNDAELAVCEDAGETIACHVWDAGVAAVACIDALLQDGQTAAALPADVLPFLRQVLRGKTPLRVLELGTGVGLLGCYIACRLPGAHVTLTDLPPARECAQVNAAALCASGTTSVKRHQPEFEPLDWTEDLPASLSAQHVDLVVASDCIYNPDFSPALAKTMHDLASLAPEALFLVAAKTRHSTEAVFFDEMADKGFTILEQETILAPLEMDEEAMQDAELVQVYVFSRGRNPPRPTQQP